MTLSFVKYSFGWGGGVKRENYVVPFLKMIFIWQVIFMKEAILIPWEFAQSTPMLNSLMEWLNLFVKNQYNCWEPPFVLLMNI